MTSYLDLADVLQVVGRYGFHVRDAGLLASALARPQATIKGTEVYASLPMKAAALLESVARFHPLLDGNKRTAWTLMVFLLWINGYRHDFSADEGFDLLLSIASGEMSLGQGVALITRHLVSR